MNNVSDILDISIVKGYINIVPPAIFNQLYHVKKNVLSNNNLAMKNSSVKLTQREFDCAKFLLKGHRIKEIAALIHLSPRTVETHINNLKIKLNCRDKVELIIKLTNILSCD